MATFGAQAVDLEVDLETGRITILKVAAAQDFGKAINPKLCVSQVYGGVEFGVGYALMEEGVYDPATGKLLSNNLHQYRMPTSCDYPEVEVMIAEAEDPYLAYSAKGAGENTNAPTPAAVRNALYHATGIRLNDLPITPDKSSTPSPQESKGLGSSPKGREAPPFSLPVRAATWFARVPTCGSSRTKGLTSPAVCVVPFTTIILRKCSRGSTFR